MRFRLFFWTVENLRQVYYTDYYQFVRLKYCCMIVLFCFRKNHNLAGIGPITFCCCCCYFCCCLLYQFRFFFCIMIYSVQSFSPDKSTSVRLIFTFAFVVSAKSCLSYLVFLDVMLLHTWKYRGFAWAQACQWLFSRMPPRSRTDPFIWQKALRTLQINVVNLQTNYQSHCHCCFSRAAKCFYIANLPVTLPGFPRLRKTWKYQGKLWFPDPNIMANINYFSSETVCCVLWVQPLENRF